MPHVEPWRFRWQMALAITLPVLLLALFMTWEVRALLGAHEASDRSSVLLVGEPP